MGSDKALYKYIPDLLTGALSPQVEFSYRGSKCPGRKLCPCEIHCCTHDLRPQAMTSEIRSQPSTHVKGVGAVVASRDTGIFTKAAKCDQGIILIED